MTDAAARGATSGDDVGCQRIFQKRNPVFQGQFLLLEPLDLQRVGNGCRFKCPDGAVEVPVFFPKPCQLGLDRIEIRLGHAAHPLWHSGRML